MLKILALVAPIFYATFSIAGSIGGYDESVQTIGLTDFDKVEKEKIEVYSNQGKQGVYRNDKITSTYTWRKPTPPPPPIAKFSWPAIQKIMVSTRRYSTYRWKFFKSISSYSTVYISSPCGNTRTMKVSNPFETKSVRMCGSTVSIRRHGGVTTRIYISAGSL